ncbi:hypothetical protein D9M68_926460 [compost metagenome]
MLNHKPEMVGARFAYHIIPGKTILPEYLLNSLLIGGKHTVFEIIPFFFAQVPEFPPGYICGNLICGYHCKQFLFQFILFLF